MIDKRRSILIICSGFVLAFFIGFIPIELSWPLVVIALGLVVGITLILAMQPDDHLFLITIFLGGFLLRIILSITLHLISFVWQIYITYLLSVKQGFFLAGDDYCYSANAAFIVEVWKRLGTFPSRKIVEWICLHYSANTSGYDYWNSYVYFITGKSPVTMFFINCLVSSLTAIILYFITRQLFNSKAARISCAICMFWPSLIFWSTLNLKEPLTIFLIAVILWCSVNILKKFYLGYLLIGLSSFLALFKLRSQIGILIPATFLLALAVYSKRGSKFILVLFCVLLLIPLLGKEYIFSDFQKVLLKFDYLQDNVKNLLASKTFSGFTKNLVFLRAAKTQDSSSAFMAGADISVARNIAKFLPVSLFYVFFAPFPWQLGSFMQIFGAAEMMIWYFLLRPTFRGFMFCVRNKWRESSVIIMFIGVTAVVLALVEGNVGTLFRHRAIILFLWFIFTGIGMSYEKGM